MINIDQEILCDYCEAELEYDRTSCEGAGCINAKEMYLEDHGITDSFKNTFTNLTIESKIRELLNYLKLLEE